MLNHRVRKSQGWSSCCRIRVNISIYIYISSAALSNKLCWCCPVCIFHNLHLHLRLHLHERDRSKGKPTQSRWNILNIFVARPEYIWKLFAKMVQSVCHHQSAVQKDLYGNWKVLIIQKRNARFISSYLSIRGAEEVPVKVKTTIVVQGGWEIRKKKRYELKKLNCNSLAA